MPECVLWISYRVHIRGQSSYSVPTQKSLWRWMVRSYFEVTLRVHMQILPHAQHQSHEFGCEEEHNREWAIWYINQSKVQYWVSLLQTAHHIQVVVKDQLTGRGWDVVSFQWKLCATDPTDWLSPVKSLQCFSPSVWHQGESPLVLNCVCVRSLQEIHGENLFWMAWSI